MATNGNANGNVTRSATGRKRERRESAFSEAGDAVEIRPALGKA